MISRKRPLFTAVRLACFLAASLVFLLVLVLVLTVTQIGDSFLDPESYASELDKHDVYEFVLVDLATAALEDRRIVEEAKSGADVEDTPLASSGLTTGQIVSSINRAVPPDWVQEVVEQALDDFLNYIAGRSDEFTVTLSIGERADFVLAEIRTLLDEGDAYNVLYERALIPRIEEAADDWVREDLPLEVEVTSERLVLAARAVLPQEWVRGQVERVLDEVTPYLKSESDGFTINVQLPDRVEIAVAEVKEILAESSANDLLYDDVIVPRVSESLRGSTEELPFGVTISSDEVVTVLREVAPPAWVRGEVERLIDEVAPYLAGQVDTFETEISLADNKRQAHEVLTGLAETRIQAEIDGLPVCQTIEQEQSALGGPPGRLPVCIPPNVARDRLFESMDIDPAEVTRSVLAPIPDTISFSPVQLREALEEDGATDNVGHLDDVRAFFKDGWTYTQDDLKADLTTNGDESGFETLQDVRSLLADGWTYTNDDFTEDVGEENGSEAIAAVDFWGGLFGTFGWYRWIIYLSAIVLLAAVGFLGGGGWSGRVKWGSGSLLACAGVIAVLFGLIYPALASNALDNARVQALDGIDPTGDYAETTRLAVDKGFDVIESVSDGFAAGIATSSIVIVIVAGVVLAVAVNRHRIAALVRRVRQR